MAETPANITEFLDHVRKYGMEGFGIYLSNYRGVIVDNKDPKKLGRVKLRVAQIGGDNKIEYWAWPKGQVAGGDFGDFMVPPVNSQVWVEFENGDPRHPIWSGGGWNATNGKVPEEARLDDPKNRVRKSEKWIMEMDDAGEYYRVTNRSTGSKMEMDGSGNIKLSGTQKVSAEALNVELQGSVGAKLTCGSSSVELTPLGLLMKFAGKEVKLDGSGLSIDGVPYLDHQHFGVKAGPDVSGGVV